VTELAPAFHLVLAQFLILFDTAILNVAVYSRQKNFEYTITDVPRLAHGTGPRRGRA
jgi:hypothetical protein